MKKTTFLMTSIIGIGAITCWSFTISKPTYEDDIATLRKLYSSGDYNQWPKPSIDESVKATFKDIGSLGEVPYPADNQPNEDKKNLGKMLFFDPRLSLSNQIACASC
ncbi:MAG: cytochrome c peroxidase, partial [Chitinophagaceae bacterium]